MNGLQIFCYNGRDVRTIEDSGETWWVLKDVCDVLGLSNARRVAERLDNDELTSLKVTAGGQRREMNCVNEPGLYSVILRSDKPEAKAFKRWVTHEVLPQIRKTGGYGGGNEEVIARTVGATVSALMGELRPYLDGRETTPRAPAAYVIEPQQSKIESFPPELREQIDDMIGVMRSTETLNFSEIARYCVMQGYPVSIPSVSRYYRRNY